MNEKDAQYSEIFRQNKGILRASTAQRLGVPRHKIYEMTRNGNLIQEARGLYRLADIEPLGDPDLVGVALLVPRSVIFLISALYFHRLTTQIPHRIYIALPHGTKAPRIDYPPLYVYHPRDKAFSAGIEVHEIGAAKVRVYNQEKTITDCFKYRNQLGFDIALEALKDYMRAPSPNTSRLMEYARINRVEKTIRPYVESLL